MYCASTQFCLVNGRPNEAALCVILRCAWLLCGRAWIPCSQAPHDVASPCFHVYASNDHVAALTSLHFPSSPNIPCAALWCRQALNWNFRPNGEEGFIWLRIHGLLTRWGTVRVWERTLLAPRRWTDCGGLTDKLKRGTNCWIWNSYSDHCLLGHDVVFWSMITTWFTLRTWRWRLSVSPKHQWTCIGTVRIASSSGAFAPPLFNSLENGNVMETL
jgi:hypothetical protein